MLDHRIGGPTPALIRRWHSIAPDIEQSALNQHFVSIHLGGAKRLQRRGEGDCQVRDVASGAYSVVPAGSAFRWFTEGPIDFMHIYLDPRTIDDFVVSSFECDPRRVSIQDSLGASDRLISSLSTALMVELSADGGAQPAYLDDLMHLFVFQTLRLHTNALAIGIRAPHTLAPCKLRQAIDFIDAHLTAPIGVADIASAVGMSPFHFSRAFRGATGMPPYAFLVAQRIAAAKSMLASSPASISEIARRCGFASLSQFSRMFKQSVGCNPSKFRIRL